MASTAMLRQHKGVLGVETTHCYKDSAIHHNVVYDVLPMTSRAVRALPCC